MNVGPGSPHTRPVQLSRSCRLLSWTHPCRHPAFRGYSPPSTASPHRRRPRAWQAPEIQQYGRTNAPLQASKTHSCATRVLARSFAKNQTLPCLLLHFVKHNHRRRVRNKRTFELKEKTETQEPKKNHFGHPTRLPGPPFTGV